MPASNKYAFLLLLGFCVFASVASLAKAQEEINITGKVRLIVEDKSGEIVLGQFLNSAEELKSAKSCSIEFSAYDDFHNTYPGYFRLSAVEPDIVYAFSMTSKYIDENSRYHRIPITSASIRVADKLIDDVGWRSATIKQKYALMALNTDLGLGVYHELTMGQPAKVRLVREILPKVINIELPPLTSRQSAIARKCIKFVLGDI